MDFKYSDTVIHNGVVFYITDGGHRVYFLYGGCLLSVPRPHATAESGEIAKFGLTLRGLTHNDRVVANYVRSELNRTGRHESAPSSEEDVFVDRLEVLAQGTQAFGRDICGSFDLEVYDPYLAECMVSLKVTSGLIVSTGRDIPQDGMLHLYTVPTITNASSGFIYTPNIACFTLVQAYLTELPPELETLISGLFDRIPVARPPLRDESGGHSRTDIIVTSPRAVKTMAIGGTTRCSKRPLRKTVVSDFVQVRLIPKPCSIWDSASRVASGASLQSLQLLFKIADEIILIEEPWPGLDEHLNQARSTIVDAILAVYGNEGKLRFFGGKLTQQGVTTLQRFVLCQFILGKWNLINCYAALEQLAESYIGAVPEARDPLPDPHLVADAVNEIIRESGILGELCEIIVRYTQPTDPVNGSGSEVVELEARLLAEFAANATRVELGLSSYDEVRNMEARIASVLNKLYAKDGIGGAAQVACRILGSGLPVAIVLNVSSITAFDGLDLSRKGAYYLYYLLSERLKRGGVTVHVSRK
ncbi:tegument protein EUL21 [Equid alphaherpesvirus 1]|uniref:Tegument protein EUL21 n=1 Tax=Equid alphaherpesvirus 1 TaxID=10326 RepID=A0A0A7D969_9ALPH|nr:tegument protein EUL21 [Equid alphaherpesvirus 1]APQ35946.1 tegument protein EUL21 [Equid alphaherpesvirus 1]APQ36021.1 tegument protein EUL21 [Equid alphaherpesvirus 1]APQ36096.1 tegument protein EUL21 [Equid alphaherpesvirus 1]APQ36171.1 tegument protein EUL21 [Equid alphaherpesvirus 1]